MEMKDVLRLMSIFLFTGFLYSQDMILALHPEGTQFDQVLRGVKAGLGEELTLTSKVLEKGTEWGDLATDVLANKPQAFLLLDNSAVNIYREYLKSIPEGETGIPAIATMALQLELVTEGIPIMGISYEIPVVTSVVNLRPVVKEPLKKIGVIHRSSWADFIQMNADFCKTENVELVSYPIESDSPKEIMKEIKSGLKQLIKKDKIDALWIVSDNALLNGTSIVKSWLPNLKRAKMPIIVGVESLITTKLALGNFAVLPDNVALGAQTAELIFELMDAEWVIEESRIDQPLSVMKTLNTTLSDKSGFLNKEGLSTIDKEIE